QSAWSGSSSRSWLHRRYERREGVEFVVTCVVDLSPEVVDAGAEITLHAEVSRTPASDLRGQKLVIKDHAGADVGTTEFTHFDGETNETDEFVVKAPATPGAYLWS